MKSVDTKFQISKSCVFDRTGRGQTSGRGRAGPGDTKTEGDKELNWQQTKHKVCGTRKKLDHENLRPKTTSEDEQTI